MATDTADGMSSHMRGLTVTTITAVAGIAAAFVSNAVAASATDVTGVLVVAAAVLAQFPVLRVIGIGPDDLSTKDVLYVAFMTFALWFVSWGILLTAGV
ncbi:MULTISPECIES: hypothetical protein [Haloarcula]|uniref:Uncharacterized protein n=1 Tax=Haloarcula pellucida TaxID=1427151 RepID=A0A830GRA4_9EURY|nr:MULTISPECIES: hypothetical protein [Halomicroarcula]MDS0277787.1 hypothetical protein [Halomicroarcula sp. S1AR25-4]QIO21890.1 hypothetical protein G9465_05805 [Haloarcula sp. JP-L23]GGO00464.1 hypothetical protein GCM10009030_33130 [Halomicroarcula pellucida]